MTTRDMAQALYNEIRLCRTDSDKVDTIERAITAAVAKTWEEAVQEVELYRDDMRQTVMDRILNRLRERWMQAPR
jgi:hypothetical protein